MIIAVVINQENLWLLSEICKNITLRSFLEIDQNWNHIFKKSKESYKVVKGRIGAYYYLPKKESIYYYNRFYSLFSLSFFSVSVKTTQIYKKKIFI